MNSSNLYKGNSVTYSRTTLIWMGDPIHSLTNLENKD